MTPAVASLTCNAGQASRAARIAAPKSVRTSSAAPAIIPLDHVAPRQPNRADDFLRQNEPKADSQNADSFSADLAARPEESKIVSVVDDVTYHSKS